MSMLNDVANAYESMEENVAFRYTSSIIPDEDEAGLYELVFHYTGLPKCLCYFSYKFDIDDDSWADEVEFGGDDITFSVDCLNYIYRFITVLSEYRDCIKGDPKGIKPLIDYLEEHKEEKPKYYTVKEMNDVEKLEI